MKVADCQVNTITTQYSRQALSLLQTIIRSK